MEDVKRLLLIGVESHYGHGVAMGVDRYCHLHGEWEYRLGRDNSPDTIKSAELAVRQWGAQGIIACIQNDHSEQFVRNSGLPTVNVTGVRNLDVPTVICDNLEVGRIAARNFLSSGFRNFAFAALTSEISVHKRCQGFIKELSAAGFDSAVLTHEYQDEKDLNWVRNRKNLDQWLLSLPKPVALMCMYDPYALDVAWACGHLGLRVPDDVAIIGVGNEELYCQMSTPKLSSVELNATQIGYEAAQLLHKLMRGGKAPAKPILVPPGRLVSRQSSDMIAVADPDVAAAMRYIRDHAYEPISVKDVLREVPVSRKSLELRMQKSIGHTPKAEISRLRIERAKSLLEKTDLPIPAVAHNSGFTGQEIFSVFFRRKMNLTPTEYRRKCRLVTSNTSSFKGNPIPQPLEDRMTGDPSSIPSSQGLAVRSARI